MTQTTSGAFGFGRPSLGVLLCSAAYAMSLFCSCLLFLLLCCTFSFVWDDILGWNTWDEMSCYVLLSRLFGKVYLGLKYMGW